MHWRWSRREALKHGSLLGIVALVGAAGCRQEQASGPPSCTDTTGLTPAELTVRTALAYTDTSADAGRICTRCAQFVPSQNAPNACGSCKVLKGPISPLGSCRSFLAKAPS